jgi:bifunctional UDP-N-acetylglucosamine pyrophosphorylase/glucosamine-1-phosphate N-acetyltransferase
LLQKIKSNNTQREFYLTDVVELALRKKGTVLAIPVPAEDVMGINTRVDLAEAALVLRRRINEHWMLQGVTLHDPGRTYIDRDVEIGKDVVIYPNVYLEGSTKIEPNVTIYPNNRIVNSRIEEGSIVYENCSIDSSHLERGVQLGPFARLRPASHLGQKVKVGNFVELKKTHMGEGSKANHLTYLGDSTIGTRVNIGAGTITCNYDGEQKYPTIIEDGVFIGSDTQLVAPVKVGKDAYVAAGSSITEDVPPGALAIARGRQVNKPGWVAKRKKPRSH